MPTVSHFTCISALQLPMIKNLSTGSGDRVISLKELGDYKVFIASTGHATNALVAPVKEGAHFTVVNKSATTILVKRSGQATPITIAAGKTAMVLCDGTDYIRLTPDA